MQYQQPRLRDLHARSGNPVRHGLFLKQPAATGDPTGGTLTPNVSGTLGAANRAHAVVNAPWPQAGLGHVEAAALCPKTIGDRHAHLMVLYLSMPALATMGFSRLPRT